MSIRIRSLGLQVKKKQIGEKGKRELKIPNLEWSTRLEGDWVKRQGSNIYAGLVASKPSLPSDGVKEEEEGSICMTRCLPPLLKKPWKIFKN